VRGEGEGAEVEGSAEGEQMARAIHSASVKWPGKAGMIFMISRRGGERGCRRR